MRIADLVLLIVTSALMASAFLFVRIAAPSLGAYPLAAIRVTAAAALLAGLGFALRRPLCFVQGPKEYLLLGALSVAVPFTLVAWAGARLPSSTMAMLAATLPLFTAVTEAIWQRRPLGGREGAGLALGFAGVMQLVGLEGTGNLSRVPAVLAPVAASLSYAVGTLYAKTRFAGVSAPNLTLGGYAASAVLLLPPALSHPGVSLPPPRVVLALFALVSLSTVAASVLYYLLLERQDPTFTNSMAYLVPLFGTVYGALFLDETLHPAMLLAGAAILIGIGLVTTGRVGTSLGRAPSEGRTPSRGYEGGAGATTTIGPGREKWAECVRPLYSRLQVQRAGESGQERKFAAD